MYHGVVLGNGPSSSGPQRLGSSEQLASEQEAFRRTTIRVASVLLLALGPVFALSEFEEQGWLHNGMLLSLCVVGLWSLGLLSRGHLRSATATVILGVMPVIGWIHLYGERGQLTVMYLAPVMVLGMVVSDRAIARGLCLAALSMAVVVRLLRWWLGFDLSFGEWLTPTFDVLAVLATTGAMLDLGHRRTARNAAILEDAVARGEKMAAVARKASAEKSDFLARVSHELRTPLNAILGYTELIQEEEHLATEVRGDLQRVHGAAGQLLELIDRVLDLSKVESGRMEILPEPVLVVDVLERVQATAAPLVLRNRNQFVVQHHGPEMAVLDRSRVMQVLLNLLSNAARFTTDGTVTLRAYEEPGALVFDVCDTGIGIEPERIPELFQPFVQASPETTRDFGGTGLGLALCDRFVRLMGGHIVVHSAPNQGSTFRVVLPLTGLDSLDG